MGTSVIAWYGAVVSTVGLCLALYVALRDRRRVTISVQKGLVVATNTFAFDQTYVAVTVANAGRRPLTIAAVGFTRKSRGTGELLVNESVRNGATDIPEGKSHTFKVEQNLLPLADIRAVIVRDSLGNVWTKPVRL